MSLVIFTALVGMALAPGHINPVLALAALLCIAIGAGASGALNMWVDRDIDGLMLRTRARPLPAGKIHPDTALAFGMILSVLAVTCLGLFTNVAAAGLLAFTIFFYVVVYSLGLKRATPHNIVIGGAAGAFPPMIGELAVTGQLSLMSLTLFVIIFLWTPPHFWALALDKTEDYRRANIPMLPLVKGVAATRRHIFLYAIAYSAATLLPQLVGFAGPLYTGSAGVLGLVFLLLAGRVERAASLQAPHHLFAFSILHLLLIFALLLAEPLLRST